MKELIKNSEARYINYSVLLETLYKEKSLFKTEDFDYYKALLRDNKNEEERFLNSCVLEQSFNNQGLNYPFMYKNKKL